MSQSLKLSTAETVKLETQLRAELTALLTDWVELALTSEAVEEEKSRLKSAIENMFSKYQADGALQSGVSLNGSTVQKFIGQRQRTLDKKKLLQFISAAQLEQCYTEKPKKDFITIRLPGDKQNEEQH